MTEPEDDTTVNDDVIAQIDSFIAGHLRQPIAVSELAAAADMSVRGLQALFRRRLDTTPVTYLRRARMSAARAALSTPSSDATVGAIGRSLGYTNTGRFSAHYREEYGETPGETLERARRKA